MLRAVTPPASCVTWLSLSRLICRVGDVVTKIGLEPSKQDLVCRKHSDTVITIFYRVLGATASHLCRDSLWIYFFNREKRVHLQQGLTCTLAGNRGSPCVVSTLPCVTQGASQNNQPSGAHPTNEVESAGGTCDSRFKSGDCHKHLPCLKVWISGPCQGCRLRSPRTWVPSSEERA